VGGRRRRGRHDVPAGTQVTDEIACASGMDAGFGRRTKGLAVASFIVREMRERGL